MKIPRGELRRPRVVDSAAVVLRTVLDEGLTGCVVFKPQGALLLGETTRGVITFESGVPVLAYDMGREVDGHDGLEGFAVTGPTHAAVHAVSVAELADTHEVEAFHAPPGEPARVLASDERLMTKTLDAAPATRREGSRSQSAVETFLADADTIEEIRSEAHGEARMRASEWGLDDALTGDADESAAINASPDSR